VSEYAIEPVAVGIEARTLTPFAYHSLMVQGGSATLPELVGDRALAFALAASLGRLSARVAMSVSSGPCPNGRCGARGSIGRCIWSTVVIPNTVADT